MVAYIQVYNHTKFRVCIASCYDETVEKTKIGIFLGFLGFFRILASHGSVKFETLKMHQLVEIDNTMFLKHIYTMKEVVGVVMWVGVGYW